jgi:hypothetical protein
LTYIEADENAFSKEVWDSIWFKISFDKDAPGASSFVAQRILKMLENQK